MGQTYSRKDEKKPKMPTAHRIGQESPANKAIGGVPTIHYLDFMSRGRGQVVRLLWIDAGIAFDDVRYNNDEYPEYKRTKIAEMNPNATIHVWSSMAASLCRAMRCCGILRGCWGSMRGRV